MKRENRESVKFVDANDTMSISNIFVQIRYPSEKIHVERLFTPSLLGYFFYRASWFIFFVRLDFFLSWSDLFHLLVIKKHSFVKEWKRDENIRSEVWKLTHNTIRQLWGRRRPWPLAQLSFLCIFFVKKFMRVTTCALAETSFLLLPLCYISHLGARSWVLDGHFAIFLESSKETATVI